MGFSYKITVFTPTYNRAYILENLYRSLQRQRFHDFEWLVVDDGSSDGTQALVERWQGEENPFPIRYVWKENGGKCRAINKGLELAQGELFFTVDSDDYLTDDALEKVAQWEKALPKAERYCGIVANRGTSPNETPNPPFEGTLLDGNALDLYGQVKGERALIFYTEIHRKYLYPEFEGENFMTEAVTWNRMAEDGYKIRFYPDIIWIWEYLDDGLTKSGMSVFIRNPQGYGLFLRERDRIRKIPKWRRPLLWLQYLRDLDGSIPLKQAAEYIQMPYGWAVALNGMRRLKKTIKKWTR